MKIGILTGGGDCPGLNAVIRAIVRKGVFHYDDQFLGFMEGWRGVLEDMVQPLDLEAVAGILPRGGTILRTSRTNPARQERGLETCIENLHGNGVEVLIALGGDDTQSVSQRLFELGVKVVAVPKTIDNDLNGTDLCFGFDTAVSIATEAIDRVHTTAEAHNRVIVVEVMGRNAGWIALYSGVAGGADVILIPERAFDIGDIAETLKRRHDRGRYFSIIVAAEGARLAQGSGLITEGAKLDEFGHVRLGGIGNVLAAEIESRTGFETRTVILGHTQRGGSPTAFDRMLATRYGVGAIDLVHKSGFGRMVALKGNEITDVPITDAIARIRCVPQELIDVALGLTDRRLQSAYGSQV
ncbi:MAG TPA: 6-phosphofructokinase [Candidatus Angelobacter sp.]